MDKTKKLVRRELVENELLERAADLFAERGFNGTTLQDVADTVGLAVAPVEGDTVAGLFRTADDRLLAAKAQGKDRAVTGR